MYIKIGTTEYRSIRNLSFAADVDVTCSEIPSNQFVVDIVTSNAIQTGVKAQLYDEDDNLWADYWIYDCYRKSRYIYHIVARDAISLLDGRTMYQSMYSEVLVSTVIQRIFKEVTEKYGTVYTLDSAFDNETISGYLPQGSARDRLQYVCLTIGAYVKSTFTDKLEILKLPVSPTSTTIPDSDIYFRPDLEYETKVTGLQISYYGYNEIEKDDNVDWVEVNGKYYQIHERQIYVSNPNASGERGNDIVISGIGIINEDNVSGVVDRLSRIYFDRVTAKIGLVNEGDYTAGGLYSVYSGIPSLIITGYITSEDFTFGAKPKSVSTIKKTIDNDLVTATFGYYMQSEQNPFSTFVLTAPKSSKVTVKNPYFDFTRFVPSIGSMRYILYAVDEYTTTPTLAASVNMIVTCNIGILFYVDNRDNTTLLTVNQVDNVSFENGILSI